MLRFFFFLFYLFYLFLAALGLRCCARAFSGCGEQELLFVVVHGLLIAVASLVAEGFSFRWLLLLWSTGSRRCGLSSCGLQAIECRLSSFGAWA